MACLSVLPPIFCNTHIRLAGSIVSFWRALFLASRFPIRPATSLCLSAVSPCPSFPRLYKRPIPALLRLPPCPAFFCSPILAPSPLFCLFAKHFHTAAYPRSPAVVFSPLARPLLLSLSVTGFLPQTLSVLLLFPSSFAFSRALFLLFRFGARFSSLLASYTAFQSAFLSGLHLCFSCRFSLHFSKNKLPPCNTYRCACLFLSFLFFLSCPIFFGTFILLCRVPIRLKESLCPCSFLRSSLAVSSYQRLLWQSRFLRASRQNTPSRLLFYAQKNRRIRRFFLYKLFLYALAFSINSPACSMPWPLSPSPPSSLATSFCRAVSSRRCTRVRVSSFSTVFSIR